MTYLSSVFLTVATLAFSGKVHEMVQLFNAFEIGFKRKFDAKMISFTGIVPDRKLYLRLKILLLNLLYQGLPHQ